MGDIDPNQVADIARRLGPAVQEAYMTAADRLIEQGRDEGRDEGRAEGRLEGRAETVLKQLAVKFGALPSDVEERVRSATDEELERYAERVVLVGRLEQVFAD